MKIKFFKNPIEMLLGVCFGRGGGEVSGRKYQLTYTGTDNKILIKL